MLIGITLDKYLLIITEPSGELDYQTLGNMITATVLGEVREQRILSLFFSLSLLSLLPLFVTSLQVLYASYADHEHGNQVCGYRPDIDWQ